MKKTQIVYALIASKEDLFLQEIWVSVYSLRLYDADREVRVCCDATTANYIKQCRDFIDLITEIVVIPVPEEYDAKRRSREIKTSIRQYIEGSFLFLDTDTVIAGTLDYIDTLTCYIGAVLEYHLPLTMSPFRQSVVANFANVFGFDASKEEYWFNSGVLYVADNECTHEFYKRWNENWRYSAIEKMMSQDEPALMKTNLEFEYIIEELSGHYNCQPCMSVKYLNDAKIIHYLHMFFPANQSFCPFMDKSIYRLLKKEGKITDEISILIKECKSSYSTLTTIVGWQTMNFMTSPISGTFEKIYKEGGAASWLMIKFATLLEQIHKYTRKR